VSVSRVPQEFSETVVYLSGFIYFSLGPRGLTIYTSAECYCCGVGDVSTPTIHNAYMARVYPYAGLNRILYAAILYITPKVLLQCCIHGAPQCLQDKYMQKYVCICMENTIRAMTRPLLQTRDRLDTSDRGEVSVQYCVRTLRNVG